LLRRVNQGQRHSVAQGIVVAKQGQVACETLLHCRLGAPWSHAGPVGVRGERLPTLREGVLTVRLLEVRQHRGPWAHQRHPAPEQSPRRPHLRGRARGLREPPAPEEDSDLLGGAWVVCRFPPWIACIERAWPRTQGRPSRAQRSARQDHVKSHATQTTRAAREGAMVWSNGAGPACICRWTRTSPWWSRMQTSMVRACRARPQYNGCGAV
jgi:hypothetical protein